MPHAAAVSFTLKSADADSDAIQSTLGVRLFDPYRSWCYALCRGVISSRCSGALGMAGIAVARCPLSPLPRKVRNTLTVKTKTPRAVCGVLPFAVVFVSCDSTGASHTMKLDRLRRYRWCEARRALTIEVAAQSKRRGFSKRKTHLLHFCNKCG
jgi:hypothetical protein